MSAAMTVSLAACGGSGQSTGAASGTEGAGSTEGSAQADDGGNVELTYMHKLNGTEKYVGSDDINNNVYTRCYQDELGITPEIYHCCSRGRLYPEADHGNRIQRSSGSDGSASRRNSPSWQMRECWQILQKLMILMHPIFLRRPLKWTAESSWRPPRWTESFYGLPQLSAADGTCDLLWIRTDWLDNLGLKAPTTMDELLEVARAFRYDDPDGNGQDDTWGIGFPEGIS